MEELHLRTWRYIEAIILLGVISIVVAACSVTDRLSNKPDAEISGELLPPVDLDAGTWNQTPHGGSDEKSNSTPCGPTKRFK